MSVLKSLKRFIICYKKQVGDVLKKDIYIMKASDEATAIQKTCDRFNIPNKKVDRSGKVEGYIYCNEIYNPNPDLLLEDESK